MSAKTADVLANLASALDARAEWSNNSHDRDTPGTARLLASASAECKQASEVARRLQRLAEAVDAHNEQCALACAENLTCGAYRARDKRCPECPQNFRIESGSPPV